MQAALNDNDSVPPLTLDAEYLLVWITLRHDGVLPQDAISFISHRLGWNRDRALDAMAQLVAAGYIQLEAVQ